MGLIMETQIKEAKQKGFNFRDNYRAANSFEASMAQFEISEEAYKNMPSFDDAPISLEDLNSTSREARAIQMAARFQEFDRQFEHKVPTEEDLDRLDAMERFDRFNNLDAMSKDLENNNRCKD